MNRWKRDRGLGREKNEKNSRKYTEMPGKIKTMHATKKKSQIVLPVIAS